MADFSVNATELSAPKGAGSQPIAPATAGIFDNGVGENIGNIMSIFQKGLEHDAKAKQKALEDSVLQGYAREQATINDAVMSGGLSADAAARRSRALYNKTIGQYPQFHTALSGVNAAFRTGTEMGTVEDTLKTEADARNSLIKNMQSKGYPVEMNQPKAVQDSWIRAYQSSEMAHTNFQREEERKNALRAEGRYNDEIEKIASKKRAEQLLGDLSMTHLEATFSTATDYAEKVRTGAVPAQDAVFTIQKQFARIDQQINLVASSNPELATMYRSLFTEARQAAIKLLDPKATAEDTKAQLDLILNKAKLGMVSSDPKVANAVGASQLFGNAPNVAMSVMQTAGPILDKFLKDPATVSAPQVTGTEQDKPILKAIEANLKAYTSGAAKDRAGTQEELVNSTRNYMSQLGRLQGQTGIGFEQLKDAADLFSQASFGKFMSENPMNSDELKAARNVFQNTYEKQIVEAVTQSLSKSVVTNTGLVPNRAVSGATLKPTTEPLPVDVINVSFDGSSVKFGYKPTKQSTNGMAAQSTEELNKSAQAINKLIRIGAHMEGTTDYANFFERNKHVLLPQLFSGYEGLEIGQVVNGKRYVGGDANNPSSWK